MTLRAIYTHINSRLEEEFGRQLGLTVNEFEVLLYITSASPGQVRLSDLHTVSHLSQPALSRLVVRLETHGLIYRSETAADRRVVLLATTETGRDLLERGVRLHTAIVHDLLLERSANEGDERFIQSLAQMMTPNH